MQKWLAVVVLTLAALVAGMGLRNLTVRASGSSQTVLAAWGTDPVPPGPWLKAAHWGTDPVPPGPWAR
jgi:hypothetical protein